MNGKINERDMKFFSKMSGKRRTSTTKSIYDVSYEDRNHLGAGRSTKNENNMGEAYNNHRSHHSLIQKFDDLYNNSQINITRILETSVKSPPPTIHTGHDARMKNIGDTSMVMGAVQHNNEVYRTVREVRRDNYNDTQKVIDYFNKLLDLGETIIKRNTDIDDDRHVMGENRAYILAREQNKKRLVDDIQLKLDIVREKSLNKQIMVLNDHRVNRSSSRRRDVEIKKTKGDEEMKKNNNRAETKSKREIDKIVQRLFEKGTKKNEITPREREIPNFVFSGKDKRRASGLMNTEKKKASVPLSDLKMNRIEKEANIGRSLTPKRIVVKKGEERGNRLSSGGQKKRDDGAMSGVDVNRGKGMRLIGGMKLIEGNVVRASSGGEWIEGMRRPEELDLNLMMGGLEEQDEPYELDTETGAENKLKNQANLLPLLTNILKHANKIEKEKTQIRNSILDLNGFNFHLGVTNLISKRLEEQDEKKESIEVIGEDDEESGEEKKERSITSLTPSHNSSINNED